MSNITETSHQTKDEIKRLFYLLEMEYNILKSRGKYSQFSLTGYGDALWDLKMIIKDTYGIEFKPQP